MVIHVGEAANAYALTPPHMKRLVQSLTHQLNKYEKQFGSIQETRPPSIESPLQFKDIRGNGPQ